MSAWLNWAFMGAGSEDQPAVDLSIAAAELKQAMRFCIGWTARWVDAPLGDVILTDGTTAACDIVLRTPRSVRPRKILVTDRAHPTIRGAARRAAAYLSRVSGESVSVETVDLPLQSAAGGRFANAIVDRLEQLCEGAACYFIVEHVTRLGLRLPVSEVTQMIERRSLPIHVIIDGAQAVGIWECGDIGSADYIGCFYKYVNGPVGTGFAVVRGVDQDILPHASASRLISVLDSDGEVLPTLDRLKWRRCSEALRSLSANNEHTERVRALRNVLVSQGLPLHDMIPMASDSPLASHIVTFELPSADRCRAVTHLLAAKGWYVKAEDSLIRASLHHSLTFEDIAAFSTQLRAALSNELGEASPASAMPSGDWVPVHGSSEVVAARYSLEEERIYVRFYHQVEWWYGECARDVWFDFTGSGEATDEFIRDVLKLRPNGRAGILWGSP
jgi:selenocysteine lyase/cysteine desulfurase